MEYSPIIEHIHKTEIGGIPKCDAKLFVHPAHLRYCINVDIKSLKRF